MKKVFSILLCVMLIITMTGLVGRGNKYCSAPGCPSEAYSGADVCVYHKCLNRKCKNPRAGSQSYCEKCLDRALENYK